MNASSSARRHFLRVRLVCNLNVSSDQCLFEAISPDGETFYEVFNPGYNLELVKRARVLLPGQTFVGYSQSA